MSNEAINAAQNLDSILSKGYMDLALQVDELLNFMKRVWGKEYIKAVIDKENVKELIDSKRVEDRIYALQKIILKQDSYVDDPIFVLGKIQREIAYKVAKQRVEKNLEKEVDKLMNENQSKLIDEIKLNIINKKKGPENSRTIKKLVQLQRMDCVSLSQTVMERLRPDNIDEIVGQKRAVSAILSKIASPYPQHIILYGPPGVGKTTAARLALSIASKSNNTPFNLEAPFVEVDATTLRWDPRESTNPLLGSVHDPIYQGSRKELSDIGIPEPKMGLVSKAHGGILFIDEIGEMDIMLQNKLLKVLEDKKVDFSSSYYDPDDENIPLYIKKIFNEGAPADFILIGATTKSPNEINPALRSRCSEVYFEPLSKKNIKTIVLNAGKKLKLTMDDNVPKIISDYTMEGRRAINIISDVYGHLVNNKGDIDVHISEGNVYEVAALSRLTMLNKEYSNNTKEVGKAFGLAVKGFIGSVIEIEAAAFKGNDGKIRFNDTAGSMAKDSVFTALSVIRSITGQDILNYDIHVNIVGGANIDGPSAGAAITIAILSAITGKKISQDVAITGEISLHGDIKPVGGITEKIYAAEQSGMKKVLIPYDNRNDIPMGIEDIEIVFVKNINNVLDEVL